MAKSTQERSEKAAEKAKLFDEKELRHKVRPGTNAMLADLMARHNVEQISEAVQLLIINAHALPPEESAPLFKVPRHEIVISENVARNLQRLGAREAAALDTLEND